MVKFKNKSVYIVLEHATGTKDCKVHGVYTSRTIAENKLNSLISNIYLSIGGGYICILKKTPQGPDLLFRMEETNHGKK